MRSFPDHPEVLETLSTLAGAHYWVILGIFFGLSEPNRVSRKCIPEVDYRFESEFFDFLPLSAVAMLEFAKVSRKFIPEVGYRFESDFFDSREFEIL